MVTVIAFSKPTPFNLSTHSRNLGVGLGVRLSLGGAIIGPAILGVVLFRRHARRRRLRAEQASLERLDQATQAVPRSQEGPVQEDMTPEMAGSAVTPELNGVQTLIEKDGKPMGGL